jgi:hypothetical protein
MEGSLDGSSWREIDRQADHEYGSYAGESFAVSNPGAFRFIRLTQTDNDPKRMELSAVEFFETFSE